MSKKVKFKASAAAERQFYSQLRKVAIASSDIINKTFKDRQKMFRDLERYSELIGPWAERQVARLLQIVQKSNKRALLATSNVVAKHLREEKSLPIAASLLFDQVDLIKSIPLEAGLRVQHIILESLVSGEHRAEELAKQIADTEKVTLSRAKLIARTETAKANAVILEARSREAGSTHYVWETSKDEAVRPSHKKMQGKVIAWDRPPTLEDGMRGHAGEFPNCRCFPNPIFPD